MLGKWNLDAHLDWSDGAIETASGSSPKTSKRANKDMMSVAYDRLPKWPVYYSDFDEEVLAVISHFYQQGELCDLTGQPRKVIVRHICSKHYSQINQRSQGLKVSRSQGLKVSRSQGLKVS